MTDQSDLPPNKANCYLQCHLGLDGETLSAVFWPEKAQTILLPGWNIEIKHGTTFQINNNKTTGMQRLVCLFDICCKNVRFLHIKTHLIPTISVFSLHPLFPGANEVDQIAKIHDIMGTPDGSVLNKLKK